ncbi:hypothetical protein GN956_G7857 [Arapaima gigas]
MPRVGIVLSSCSSVEPPIGSLHFTMNQEFLTSGDVSVCCTEKSTEERIFVSGAPLPGVKVSTPFLPAPCVQTPLDSPSPSLHHSFSSPCLGNSRMVQLHPLSSAVYPTSPRSQAGPPMRINRSCMQVQQATPTRPETQA